MVGAEGAEGGSQGAGAEAAEGRSRAEALRAVTKVPAPKVTKALRAVMDGDAGPYRDVTIYNAAGALIVAGKATDLKDGAAQAAAAIDDGRAKAALDAMVAITNET
mgnify:CR=1 FL=1